MSAGRRGRGEGGRGREGERSGYTAAVSCSLANAPPGIELSNAWRIGMLRVAEHFAGEPVLHHFTVLHDSDEIADLRGNAQIMRDEDDREAEARVTRPAASAPAPHRDIERRHRLVGDQYIRLQRQARQPDRCRWPPENSCGKRSPAEGSSPTSANSSFASATASARGAPCTIGPCATSSAALRRGLREANGSWTPSGCDGFRGELFRAAASPSPGRRARSNRNRDRSAARCSARASTFRTGFADNAERRAARQTERDILHGRRYAGAAPQKTAGAIMFEASAIVRTLEGNAKSFSNRGAKRKILPENNVLTACSACSFLRARRKGQGSPE